MLFSSSEKNLLHFIATSPKIYSAFDRFNLELCKKLNKKGYKSVFIYADRVEHKPIISDLLKESAEVEILNTQKGFLYLFVQIFKLYVKYRPKNVHTHFMNSVRICNSLLSKIFLARSFNSIHSMYTAEKLSSYKKKKGTLKFYAIRGYLKFLILSSERIIAISKAIQNDLKKLAGTNSEKVTVSYVGSRSLKTDEQDKKKLREFYQLPSHKILIANIGAFEKLKGIEVLVKAVSILVNKMGCDNFVVYHIGGNRRDDEASRTYNHAIFKMCSDLDIHKYIQFMGPRNDVPIIFPAFDIYVHPSLTEGLGSVIVEAISAGLPVVASNTGGIPEVVKNNVNGYLTNIDDEQELAEKLKELIDDKKKCKKFGVNSYTHFENNFELHQSVNSLIGLYNIK